MRLLLIFICLCCFSCKIEKNVKNAVPGLALEKRVRPLHDTIGFTKYNWQLDSIYNRLGIKDSKNNMQWKAAISPHDDYNTLDVCIMNRLKELMPTRLF